MVRAGSVSPWRSAGRADQVGVPAVSKGLWAYGPKAASGCPSSAIDRDIAL